MGGAVLTFLKLKDSISEENRGFELVKEFGGGERGVVEGEDIRARGKLTGHLGRRTDPEDGRLGGG